MALSFGHSIWLPLLHLDLSPKGLKRRFAPCKGASKVRGCSKNF